MRRYISAGVGYMLLATLLFAIMNALVKMVPRLPAVEIVFFRSLVSFIICYGMLMKAGVHPWGNNKGLLVLRGATGAVALTFFFITLQNIPLASAVTMQYLSPIFTSLLGIFLVKERVFPLQFLFFGVSFGGVLLLEGFDARVSDLYLFLGISSALFSGIAYNIIRRLGNREHPLVIVLYFPLVTIPLTGIYVAMNWVQPIGVEWLYLLAIGVLTQGAQFYMTKAFQAEELSKVASLQYLGIIYALMMGWVFFGETFNVWSYLGMLLVLIGVILNIWYKSRKVLN